MDPATRGILFAAFIVSLVFLGKYMRQRMRMFELTLNKEKEFSSGLRAELDQIRDRLATLETIVTDKGYQIKDEISKL